MPPYLLPQTAIFGFLDEPDNQNFVLLNLLLLLFKLNVTPEEIKYYVLIDYSGIFPKLRK